MKFQHTRFTPKQPLSSETYPSQRVLRLTSYEVSLFVVCPLAMITNAIPRVSGLIKLINQ